MTPTRVDDGLVRSWPLPTPGDDADKEARGRVLVVGGSNEVPGGVLLAGTAALRAGAGKLRLATTRSAAIGVAVALPEARVFGLPETAAGCVAPEAASVVGEIAGSVDAVVVGPGMTSAEGAVELLAAIAARPAPAVVVDAAALYCLGEVVEALRCLAGRVVLTPNRDELAAMGDPDVAELARAAGAVVSVKGATTVTVCPDGRRFEDPAGNAGLATSGSGDVLAGIVGGLLARGAAPDQAAVWANHVHGVAGERLALRIGPVGFLSRELADEVPAVLRTLAPGSPS